MWASIDSPTASSPAMSTSRPCRADRLRHHAGTGRGRPHHGGHAHAEHRCAACRRQVGDLIAAGPDGPRPPLGTADSRAGPPGVRPQRERGTRRSVIARLAEVVRAGGSRSGRRAQRRRSPPLGVHLPRARCRPWSASAVGPGPEAVDRSICGAHRRGASARGGRRRRAVHSRCAAPPWTTRSPPRTVWARSLAQELAPAGLLLRRGGPAGGAARAGRLRLGGFERLGRAPRAAPKGSPDAGPSATPSDGRGAASSAPAGPDRLQRDAGHRRCRGRPGRIARAIRDVVGRPGCRARHGTSGCPAAVVAQVSHEPPRLPPHVAARWSPSTSRPRQRAKRQRR